MFPFYRFGVAFIKAKFKPRINYNESYTSTHWVLPWDIDFFGELNNGQTLAIMDCNRVAYGDRIGWNKVIVKRRWGMTMAGVSVRYRQRVFWFQKMSIHCICVGRDDKFFYIVQTMFHREKPTSQALYRLAVTNKNGLIPTDEMAKELDIVDWRPEMPEWIKHWIAAENTRIWPPEINISS